MMTHRGFFVQPDRKIKPCCVFTDFDTPVLYDETKSFDEMFNSPQFLDLRQKMDSGIVHKGCEGCFNGKTEMREGLNTFLFENDYNLLKSIIPTDKKSTNIHYLDLRLSNLCNFKCRMCNETYSSSWAQEKQKLNIPISKLNGLSDLSDNYLDVIKENIKDLKYLYLGGGEPFIMKETFELLDLLTPDHKSKITLALNTNLSTLTYKGKDILDILGSFQSVYFNVSCDGINEIGEYQRTGFETLKFENNVKKVLEKKKQYGQFEIRFTYALGAVNIFHITDFLNYIKDKFNLTENNVGVEFIEWPWYYNIGNSSPEFKNKVKNFIDKLKINKNSELYRRLNSYKTFIDQEFTITDPIKDLKFIDIIDKHRGDSLKRTAPWVVDSILNYNLHNKTI